MAAFVVAALVCIVFPMPPREADEQAAHGFPGWPVQFEGEAIIQFGDSPLLIRNVSRGQSPLRIGTVPVAHRDCPRYDKGLSLLYK